MIIRRCRALPWSTLGKSPVQIPVWRLNILNEIFRRFALLSGKRMWWHYTTLRKFLSPRSKKFLLPIHSYVISRGSDLVIIQGESLARGPKLLSIKNSVIEIMTWKFIYTYRERCKTGPTHKWCWNWSPFTSKHTWMRFSKFWNTFPEVSTLTAWISWRIASFSCSIVRGVFLYTLPLNRPQRKKSQGVRSASLCL